VFDLPLKMCQKIVIADFTKGSQVYEHIEKETADVPISILGKFN